MKQLADLTKAERAQLEINSKYWQRQLAARKNAAIRAGRITAKDLNMRVGGLC